MAPNYTESRTPTAGIYPLLFPVNIGMLLLTGI